MNEGPIASADAIFGARGLVRYGVAAMTPRTASRLQWLQWALFVLGGASLAWCGLVIGEARLFQWRQRAVFEQMSRPARHEDGRLTETRAPLVARGVIGRLEIPSLELSAVVAEGDDEDTLKVAVGHLPDTPLPWQAGNSALAGHRDTFFRPLKRIRPGDEMRLATPQGELRYVVERTRIVKPDDLSVLAPSADRRLTLITCFPFSYIGQAPYRFIVHARQIGPASAVTPPVTSEPSGRSAP
jgi:sortase A